MKDNDIIKALECCCKGDKKDCFECPLQNKWDCHKELREKALDLINRQKAEIERLNIRNKALTDITKNYDWKFEKAKSEAIKEFAERLNGILKKKRKNEQSVLSKTRYGECILAVDNLVKEMVGDDE